VRINPQLLEKIKESLSSVLPITAIVLLLSVSIVPLTTGALVLFLFGSLLLIVGVGVFTLGVDMSMTPMGSGIGAYMSRARHMAIPLSVALVLGMLITIAEQDLTVLAEQVPAIHNQVLILTVSAGVGAYLVIALLRTILHIPLSRLLLGTSVGTPASIVPLVAAAAPFVARIVESSLRELDAGVVEAAQAMGCTPWQIITKVMLSECRPSLINGLTTATITILSYGAMAGAIGAGGLGSMALMKGYQRQMTVMLWGSVILLVLLVQLIQSIGTALSVKTDRRINPTESRRRKRK